MTKQEAQALLVYKDELKRKQYASKPQIRKYDYVFNGRLRIVFDDGKYIRDNNQQKLEDKLAEILVRLYENSEEHRIVREQREEAHRKYLEDHVLSEEEKSLQNKRPNNFYGW